MPQTSDSTLRDIFERTKVIALVGASANRDRPSHFVGEFLRAQGYRVIGVNPGLAGQQLFGEPVFASLADIDAPVDMVDIFRRSDAVPAIVDDALANLEGLRTIWMQHGVTHPEAAKIATDRGVTVVQDRCPKIEIPRLFQGEPIGA